MKKTFCIFFLALSLSALAQKNLQQGFWHAEFKLNDTTQLPFVFESFPGFIEIINGDERIKVDEIVYVGDSVFLQMPVYETEIRCAIKDNMLEGSFINHSRTTNAVLPFKAIHGMGWRFTDRPEKTTYNISGRWHVIWDNEEGENKLSVGIFNQEGNRVTGTFLTPTGDYRFLEGEIGGSQLHLSSFDASHAYLFDAIIEKDGSMHGNYFSGSHWHDTWSAYKDSTVELVDPESLTFIKPEYNKLQFSFLDQSANLVSLDDIDYQNKVVVIQLMGTWCSNCLDETKYLVDLSKKYSTDKFKIISLDFEKTTDSVRINKNIERIKDRLNINYPILYAGSSRKEEAVKSLPMLNRIVAFPTTIIIDKKGAVRKIHTGFSGPATGIEYSKHTEAFSSFLEKLMLE